MATNKKTKSEFPKLLNGEYVTFFEDGSFDDFYKSIENINKCTKESGMDFGEKLYVYKLTPVGVVEFKAPTVELI